MSFSTAATMDKVASSSKLTKDDSLKDFLKELAKNQQQLEEDFQQVKNFVEKTGRKKTTIGTSVQNQPYNRYQEVGECLIQFFSCPRQL